MKTNKNNMIIEVAQIAVFLIITLSAMFVPLISGYTGDDFDYEVMPGSGKVNQEILVWVRGIPVSSTDPASIYIYWDEILVSGGAVSCLGVAPNYQHAWDFKFTPPVGYNLKGKHKIVIWFLINNVLIDKGTWQYTIEDGLPPVEWWQTLPQALLNEIRGTSGIQGIQGETGATGEQGPKGDSGIEGVAGQTGAIGTPGTLGSKGEQGPKGDSGASSGYTIYGVLAISIISLVLSINLYRGEAK